MINKIKLNVLKSARQRNRDISNAYDNIQISPWHDCTSQNVCFVNMRLTMQCTFFYIYFLWIKWIYSRLIHGCHLLYGEKWSWTTIVIGWWKIWYWIMNVISCNSTSKSVKKSAALSNAEHAVCRNYSAFSLLLWTYAVPYEKTQKAQ